MPWVAASIGAVGSIAGSAISSAGASKAADKAADAQRMAALLQQQQADQARNDLAPYRNAGTENLYDYSNFYKAAGDQYGSAFSAAQDRIPQNLPNVPTEMPVAPKEMTQEELESTPGYKFARQQGLRAVSNSNSAKGLGISGNALQGAAKFATGLADQTYQNQIQNRQLQFENQQKLFGNRQSIFDMYQKNYANQHQIYQDYLSQAGLKTNQLNSIYSMLGGPATLGANAAAKTGSLGQQSAENIGENFGQIGNAQARGEAVQANLLSGGVQSLANIPSDAMGYQNMLRKTGQPSLWQQLTGPSTPTAQAFNPAGGLSYQGGTSGTGLGNQSYNFGSQVFNPGGVF